jgi:hypothetical protein
MYLFIYLFELNILQSKFKICFRAAQKHLAGRGLKTPGVHSSEERHLQLQTRLIVQQRAFINATVLSPVSTCRRNVAEDKPLIPIWQFNLLAVRTSLLKHFIAYCLRTSPRSLSLHPAPSPHIFFVNFTVIWWPVTLCCLHCLRPDACPC